MELSGFLPLLIIATIAKLHSQEDTFYVYKYSACMPVYRVCLVPQGPGEGTGLPGTRVMTCHMTLGTEVRPSAKASGALSF